MTSEKTDSKPTSPVGSKPSKFISLENNTYPMSQENLKGFGKEISPANKELFDVQ
jgi:hypothetical protein